MYELLVYVNFTVAFVSGTIYLRNFIRCRNMWKWLKFMHMFTLYIVALVYLMYAVEIVVNPIIVRLNTTLLITLFGIDGILGRSKYGKRA